MRDLLPELKDALAGTDWNSNIAIFVAMPDVPNRMALCMDRIAIWSRQIEEADSENPALPFMRDVQICGQQTIALGALAMYRPSASAMRALVENVLKYSYFRTHPSELATLGRETGYYVERNDIMEYHAQHTLHFSTCQEAFGLTSLLNTWYKDISGIVHGQIPGRWISGTSLNNIKHDTQYLHALVTKFEEGETLAHYILLCTVARDLWSGVSHDAKKALLRGLTGDQKKSLRL